MLCSSIASPLPALDPAPLAVVLCLRYSPETSQPDESGRRHRVLPLAFRDDVADGRSVPLTDPVGFDLGQVRVVEVAAGLRVEVFDADLLKRITRAKMPMGLAATWQAERYVERGIVVTTRANLLAVALTDRPAFDACELNIVK